MTYHGAEAFRALSDEQRAGLRACAGAILAAVLISSRDSREHAQAARNEGAAAVAAAANPASQPARVHRRDAIDAHLGTKEENRLFLKGEREMRQTKLSKAQVTWILTHDNTDNEELEWGKVFDAAFGKRKRPSHLDERTVLGMRVFVTGVAGFNRASGWAPRICRNPRTACPARHRLPTCASISARYGRCSTARTPGTAAPQ